jgi:uncharacterized membrane protein YoaK (UPF0700 family)
MENSEYRKNPVMESLPFGMILAVAGGFLDSYTYIGRGGVFCNAQTGNLVLLGIHIAKGELYASFAYLLPVVAFICGVIAAEAIKTHGGKIFRADWPFVALGFEIAVLFAIGLLPGKGADMPVTLTASFAASLQVSSFNRFANSSFSTTMCTGNLRLAVQTAHAGLVKKSKNDLYMSVRYWLIIFAFVIGAGVGAFVTAAVGARAIWFAAGSLAIAMGLLVFES